jgi:hypothetical protein
MDPHPSIPRPLLILDLDETLIFGTRDRLDRPFDAVLEPYAIYHRPGVAGFLDSIADRPKFRQFEKRSWREDGRR